MVRLLKLANQKCPNTPVVAGGYSYVILPIPPPFSSAAIRLSMLLSCFKNNTDDIISQGAALAAAAISDLSTTVRDQVVGTVLFGYTKNLQNRGAIPNYPSDRLKVFCAVGDLVCTGTLTITAAHLSYGDEARNEAPQFLESKIGN
jgi:cutinase